MTRAVLENGEGTVDYVWPRPGEAKAQPKSSYVMGFEPWQVNVGTGIYIDDVQAIKSDVTRNVLVITGFITLVIVKIFEYSVF